MKKLLCLFSAALLVLTSCSNNDNNSSSTTTYILPKTIKHTYPSYPSENSTSTLVYNGNKVVSGTDARTRTDYTYDGNLIVKYIEYDIVSALKKYEMNYTYANGKLATATYAENFSTLYPTGQYKGKSVYTHNSDGTVKEEQYDINVTTGVETKRSGTTVITLANGNFVKSVDTDGAYVSTQEYVYDSKNNPFKNILGLNLLVDYDTDSSVNNTTKDTYTYSGTSNVYNTDYIYNTDGYPTKATTYQKDGTTVKEIVEYTY